MRRIKGFLVHCRRCGLTHDSAGAPDAACRAWEGSMLSGNSSIIAACWDKLLEEVHK